MNGESFNRLQALRLENTQKGYDMAEQRGRFAALAARHEAGTAPKAVSAFNLFQTPKPIAERMAGMLAKALGGNPFPSILEPSAGLGRLYNATVKAIPESRIYLVEQSPDCCKELYRITRDGDRLFQRDFEETAPEELRRERFDAAIMNPPFKMGTDIRHIMHALDCVKPGGILIALCYDGTRQNQKLKPLADSWEVLPEGSFKDEGTGSSVALLTIKRKKITMKTTTMKTEWQLAWQQTRLLNWGTLHFCYSPRISSACKNAYNGARRCDNLEMPLWERLRYHKAGFKIIT
jgi:hypothetical protein